MHTPPGCVGLGVCRGVKNTDPRTQNAHSARVCGAGCLPCCGEHLSPDTECTLRQGVLGWVFAVLWRTLIPGHRMHTPPGCVGLGVCRVVENTYPRTQNAHSARVCGAECLPCCGEHLSPDTECTLRQGVWGWVFAVLWRTLTPGHRMHTPPGCVGLGVCRVVENTYPRTQNAHSARVCGAGCLPCCGEHLPPDTECTLRQGVWGWVFAVLWRTLTLGHRMHTPPGCVGLGVCRVVENTYPRTQNAHSARVCGAGCLPWCGEHLPPDTECTLRQGVWGWVFAVLWRTLTPGHRMQTPPGGAHFNTTKWAVGEIPPRRNGCSSVCCCLA